MPPPAASAAPRLPRAVRPRTRSPRAAAPRRAASGALRRAHVSRRAWIGIFAVALLGLVFLQVSLLKLNTAISVNVDRAGAIERDNSTLRGTISRLEAGRRIEDVAGQLGMVMPGAGAVCYLDASSRRPCSGGDVAAAATATDPLADTTPTDSSGEPQGVAAAPAAATAGDQAPVTTQDQAPAQDQTQAQPDPTTSQDTTTGGAAPQTQQQAPVQDTTAAPQQQSTGQSVDAGTGGVSATTNAVGG